MKKIIAYLLAMLLLFCSLALLLVFKQVAIPSNFAKLALYCGLAGGVGGVTYCLRGVYLNACVYKQWDKDWLPWYFIRPIVSFITGVISCLFLKAGLIVLEAKQMDGSSNLAFYALAFVAGLNVDRFIEKVESIAQVTWGIKKSRTSTLGKEDQEE